jgi:hypothetical protein
MFCWSRNSCFAAHALTPFNAITKLCTHSAYFPDSAVAGARSVDGNFRHVDFAVGPVNTLQPQTTKTTRYL